MSDRKRILIVDDEADLAELISYNLERAGYNARVASDGRAGLEQIEAFKPDLVVLDVMMPELSGIHVAERMRDRPDLSAIPVIMLTALSNEDDELKGLDAGADDYITKPFSVKILEARIEALLRRSESKPIRQGTQSLGAVRIDSDAHQATVDGKVMRLTVTEFRLLSALIAADGRVLSRAVMIEEAMGPGVAVTERTVDVHITAVRKKLGREHARMIKTVRGVGYRATLEPDVAVEPERATERSLNG